MELKQILRIVRRWGWLGAIPVVVVAAYLALTTQPPAPTYQVILRFTTGGEPAAALSSDYDRYYAWLSSEYVANGLADLAMTGAFAEGVAERLAEDQITVPPQAIQGAIHTDNAQSVTVVYLTWPDAEQIVTVAEAISAELIEEGPRYYPQMDTLGSVARQADPATPILLAPSLRAQLLGPAMRLALAVGVGAALMLAAHYADPWVRDTEELASLGLDIVGVVPRSRSLVRKS